MSVKNKHRTRTLVAQSQDYYRAEIARLRAGLTEGVARLLHRSREAAGSDPDHESRECEAYLDAANMLLNIRDGKGGEQS